MTSGYKVLLRPAAVRDLDRLELKMRSRVVKALRSLEESPRPWGAKKLVGGEAQWRLRVGNYRILYEVLEDTNTVRIFRVVHRREAYR
ncbi:MAG: type II toxin-antitoxin system RelE/ParE family toxin [Candidatus Brocadiales bacterium]